GAFVRRGILSLDSTSSGVTDAQIKSTAKAAAAAAARVDRRVQTLSLPAQRLGLNTLLVAAPASAPRFAGAPAAPSLAARQPPSRETAAQSFVEDLFRRDRVEMNGHGDPDTHITQPNMRKTHELVTTEQKVELRRRIFDYGFSIA